MKTPQLVLSDICWSIDGKAILKKISLEVNRGEFVGLLGPNGSGKSSLLRTIFRYSTPDSGTILLDGAEVTNFTIKESAQRIATVLQERSSEFNLTVFEFVMMGRTPHKTLFDFDNSDDLRLAEESLAEVGLTPLQHRHIRSLSGGELQRVLLARALCQQAELLLLDEPTNHLDIRYQLEMMQLIKRLGLTSLAALHDLNLAAMFCDRIYLLAGGELVAGGTPQEVLSEELIFQVYGVRAKLQQVEGRPHLFFLAGSDAQSTRP